MHMQDLGLHSESCAALSTKKKQPEDRTAISDY